MRVISIWLFNKAFVTERIETTLDCIFSNRESSFFENEVDLKLKLKEILEGLKFLNEEKNFGHFNLKPSNIFVTESKLKIGGFALLKYMEEGVHLKDEEMRYLNYFYCDPCIIYNKKLYKSSDLYSFFMMLYKVFLIVNKTQSNYISSVIDESNFKNFIDNINGVSKNKFINEFPVEFRDDCKRVLFANPGERISIKNVLNNNYFKDPLIKILEIIDNFLILDHNEQINFINLLIKNISKFPDKIIKSRIISFLKNITMNDKLSANIVLAFLYIIEQNIVDDKFINDQIKPSLTEIFSMKNLSGNCIYTFMYNFKLLIKIYNKSEINDFLYNKYLKCLSCNSVKIQQLTIKRGLQIIDHLEKRDDLIVKIAQLMVHGSWELKLESLRFIEAYISKIDNNLKLQVILPNIESVCKEKDLNSFIYEACYRIIKHISNSSNFSINQHKILPICLNLLLYSNLYKETFEELYKFVNKLITNAHNRVSELNSKERSTYSENIIEEKTLKEHISSINLKNNAFEEINKGNYFEDYNNKIGLDANNNNNINLFEKMNLKQNKPSNNTPIFTNNEIKLEDLSSKPTQNLNNNQPIINDFTFDFSINKTNNNTNNTLNINTNYYQPFNNNTDLLGLNTPYSNNNNKNLNNNNSSKYDVFNF